ncbi:DNA polymerase III subunit beta [bacterium]|nr:DNA polymerase III subunit beta [bacterium]
MKFLIEKEELLKGLRIVEKITLQRGIQLVLANFLLETKEDEIIFSSTDYDNSVKTSCRASIEKEGKITLPAKKLFDIVSKLPDKPISFELNEEKSAVMVKSGNSKFEIIGISASEFPEIIKEEELKTGEIIKLEVEPIVKAVKKCVYSAASYETRNVISGVFCAIKNNSIEMAATDGNRLSKYTDTLASKEGVDSSVVIPAKSLLELLRIVQITEDKFLEIILNKTKIIYKTDKFILISRLQDGVFPPYNQLIPQNCEKVAVVERQGLIDALERMAIIVDGRTSIVKFNFNENVLTITADSPNEGKGEEILEIEYSAEELDIAFNYKYVLESLKNMEEEKVKIWLSTSLSATVFLPDEQDNYLCLIMPMEVRA